MRAEKKIARVRHNGNSVKVVRVCFFLLSAEKATKREKFRFSARKDNNKDNNVDADADADGNKDGVLNKINSILIW